jgi:hypothetical protein
MLNNQRVTSLKFLHVPSSQRSSKSPKYRSRSAAETALVPQAAEESMSEAMLSTGEKKCGTNMEAPKILKVGTNLGEQMGASLTVKRLSHIRKVIVRGIVSMLLDESE